jgi:hypothetical protein
MSKSLLPTPHKPTIKDRLGPVTSRQLQPLPQAPSMVYHQSDEEDADDVKADLAYLRDEDYAYDYMGLVDNHPSDAEDDKDPPSRFSGRPCWESQDNPDQPDNSTKPDYTGKRMVTRNGTVLHQIQCANDQQARVWMNWNMRHIWLPIPWLRSTRRISQKFRRRAACTYPGGISSPWSAICRPVRRLQSHSDQPGLPRMLGPMP